MSSSSGEPIYASPTVPADRDSLDGLLRFLMDHGDAHLVIAGRYRVLDLVSDLAAIALLDLPETIQ